MTYQPNFKSITLIVLLFSIFNGNNFAQTKLTILYKNGKIKGGIEDYLKPNNATKWSGNYKIDEFTISDSITYYQTVETIDEKEEFAVKSIKKSRKNKTIGKAFIPNAQYCNYAKGMNYACNEYKDDNYLVKEDIKNKQENWILYDEKKVVLGYNCNKAAKLSAENEVEAVAWYFTDFKCNYSSTGDTSIPGTILETYYPKQGNLITAIDLQIETNPIVMPKGAAIVTDEEYKKILKNKK